MSEHLSDNPENRQEWQRRLQVVNNFPITQEWYEDGGERVDLKLPFGCNCYGVLSQDERGPYMLHGWVSVPEELQGNQIGERLTKALAVVAVNRGVSRMVGEFESEYALEAWRRAFGGERMKFYHDMPTEHAGPLPLTAEQAVASLHQAYAERGASPGDVSITAELDLTGLDVSGWEGPVLAI